MPHAAQAPQAAHAARRTTGRRAAAVALAAISLAALAGPARAQTATFVGRAEMAEMTLGESLVFEVTLSLADGSPVQNYQAPDTRDFRVLGVYPSQSQEISMGGGRTNMRMVYTWRYELAPTQSGRLTIGPARVRVGKRDLRTVPVSIVVHSGALAPSGQDPDPQSSAPARRQRPRRVAGAAGNNPFDNLFGRADDPVPAPPPPPAGASATEGSFVRVVADKEKVFVGEQVVVEWYLYLTDRQDKYQALTEPRTDGFWSEELTVPSNQGSLALTQQSYQGRNYLVAPLLRKALFPLQPGTLTITPMESEISQVDFFGRSLRTQRLKAAPMNIEVVPLPTAGRPAGFDAASVGHFAIEAHVDRASVGVGEAVTLTVKLSGQGNLRKLEPPRLPALAGWKTYEPKVDVKVENSDGISGHKTVEYLMLPERPGVTTVPPFELAFFDPAARRYTTEKSAPLHITVTGEAKPGSARAVAGGGNAAGAALGQVGVENVLPAEIRPPRAHPTLSRDLGTTFYQSRLFGWALFLPPLLFGATVAAGRVRERWGQETARGRRRKARRMIRNHLRAAEQQLEAGSPAAFYIEIDRTLREVLSARLGRRIAGLPRDELQGLIARSGLGPSIAERSVTALDECDRARFAPGSADPDEMRAALDRAAELILQIERAPTQAPGMVP